MTYIVTYTLHNHIQNFSLTSEVRVKNASSVSDARHQIEEDVVCQVNANPGSYMVINKVREEQPLESLKYWWEHLDIWCSYREDGLYWFRLFGIGLHFKDMTKHDLIFSERMGIKRSKIVIGKYIIKFLKYEQA